MELATRRGSKAFVAGLAKCIERDCNIPAAEKTAWQQRKDRVTRLFDPKVGGRYEVFNERPILPAIVEYCAQDVALLPKLYAVYSVKLWPPNNMFWRAEDEEETKARIKLSQSPRYDGQAADKVRGPWTEECIDNATDLWNEDIMFEAREGRVDFDWYSDESLKSLADRILSRSSSSSFVIWLRYHELKSASEYCFCAW